MAVDQTECSRIEQRPFIIFFLDEKCKQREIYRIMSDVFGERCFCKKKTMFTNGLNMFVTTNMSLKDNPWSENILTLR